MVNYFEPPADHHNRYATSSWAMLVLAFAVGVASLFWFPLFVVFGVLTLVTVWLVHKADKIDREAYAGYNARERATREELKREKLLKGR